MKENNISFESVSLLWLLKTFACASRAWPGRRVFPSQAGPWREDLVWHQPGHFHLNNRHADQRGLQRGGLPPHCQRGSVIPSRRHVLLWCISVDVIFFSYRWALHPAITPPQWFSSKTSASTWAVQPAPLGQPWLDVSVNEQDLEAFFSLFAHSFFSKRFLRPRCSRLHPQKCIRCVPVRRRPCGGSQYGRHGGGR